MAGERPGESEEPVNHKEMKNLIKKTTWLKVLRGKSMKTMPKIGIARD